MTADQVNAQLLTAKDEPEWSFNAESDQTGTPYTTTSLKSGGSACQQFLDADSTMFGKYGTTDRVTRTFLQPSGSNMLLDEVAVMPSKAKAAAMVADLTSGLKDCKSFVVTDNDSATMVTANTGAPAGHVVYTSSSADSTYSTMIITDAVQVGADVVMITYTGSTTDDPAKAQQVVTHAAEVQAAHLKAAQG
ncbi:hypothetical protein ACFQ9X_15040 [Catenulispora yoronensis]